MTDFMCDIMPKLKFKNVKGLKQTGYHFFQSPYQPLGGETLVHVTHSFFVKKTGL